MTCDVKKGEAKVLFLEGLFDLVLAPLVDRVDKDAEPTIVIIVDMVIDFLNEQPNDISDYWSTIVLQATNGFRAMLHLMLPENLDYKEDWVILENFFCHYSL